MNPENEFGNNGGNPDKRNFGPKDTIGPKTPNHSTPQDQSGDTQRVASRRYREIRNQYLGTSLRETRIQVVSIAFIGVTLLLELAIYMMMQNLTGRNLPSNYFLKHTYIFVFLFAISLLAAVQLVIVARWNKGVRGGEKSLVQSQYLLVDRINLIRIIILCAIFFLGIFLILAEREFRDFEIFMDRVGSRIDFRLPRSDRMRVTWSLYLSILRGSQISALVYFMVEIRQIIVWTRKMNRIKIVENQILADFPRMDELLTALEDENLTD